MKEILREKILALVPEYTGEGANFTQILTFNKKEITLKKNINSSLKELCRFYHFDLKSSKNTSKELLGIKKSPPVFIKDDLVLIAIKTRTPIGKDDGANSYINIEMIKKLKEGNLEFKDGNSLKVISSKKTIEKNIKNANILKEMIQGRRVYKSSDDPALTDKNIFINKNPENENTILREGKEVYSKRELSLSDLIDLKNDCRIIIRKIEAIQESLFK